MHTHTQVANSQAVAASLAESRDELRDAAATMTARYAGAEERARRLAASSIVRDTVLQVRGCLQCVCACVCVRVCMCVCACMLLCVFP